MASRCCFSAPVSPSRRPPSTASTRYKGRPPPHRGASFLSPPLFAPHCTIVPAATEPPQTTCSGLSPTISTMPRAPRRRVQPPHTPSRRPPPPGAAPTVVPLRPTTPHHRAHSSGELSLPAAPKRVHHPTALPPRTLPATPHPQAPPESGQAATSVIVAERLSYLAEMGH
jgi:hypothetical protein